MFSFARPDKAQVERLLREAAHLKPACPDLLHLREGVVAVHLPWGFSHDVTLSEIGRGERVFDRARRAIEAWRHFDLGWVQVANPEAHIGLGEGVAVQALTAGLWTLNISRITATIDMPERFGFLYATTELHVEEGQERFLLEFDRVSGRVLYLIEAVSRPRHVLARLGWPFARVMQARFRKDSHAVMRRVCGDPPSWHNK
jgi:uncharacterized protein (UPF0548 family)